MTDFGIEFCPHCGEEIDYVANTCPECGEEWPDGASYCPNCGEPVDDSDFICNGCGKTITEEDIEKYEQLTQEERTALREANLQKKSEEMAAWEALQKEEFEKRRKDREQYEISKAQDEAVIKEITDEIKSQTTFDCKLKISFTLIYIEIQARIIDTGYTLTARILQKDKASALPKFAQALNAIHEVVGK